MLIKSAARPPTASELLEPPPVYSRTYDGPEVSTGAGTRRYQRLPASLWLHVFNLLLQDVGGQSRDDQEEDRLRCHVWLSSEARTVCFDSYLASMSLLRSDYLSSYLNKVIAPYSSDPWPSGSSSSRLTNLKRETRVLDLFIARSSRDRLNVAESALFEEESSGLKTLFELWQPKARLEDLILQRAGELGLLYQNPGAKGADASQVVATDLSIDYERKEIRLLLPFLAAGSSMTPSSSSALMPLARKPVISMSRTYTSMLESRAEELLQQLIDLPLFRRTNGRQAWYEQRQPAVEAKVGTVPSNGSSTGSSSTSKPKGRFHKWLNK